MRIWATLVISALSLSVLSGCGSGGTTTIIEKTVTVEKVQPPEARTPAVEEPQAEQPPEKLEPAMLKLSAYEQWKIEPLIYGVGVSGDLAGHDLVWSNWNSDPARALGEIWQKDFSGTGEYFKFPGEVVARGLEACGGRLFYSEVLFNAEGLGERVALGTPCNGKATFDPEAVTTRVEDEAQALAER